MNTFVNQQLDLLCDVDANPLLEEAVAAMAASGDKERGAVFTRPDTVAFILDLAGYTADKPLYKEVLLEPSFGHGEFLKAAVERLLAAWQTHGKETDPVKALSRAIRAVELQPESVVETRSQLEALLRSAGIADQDVAAILNHWLIQGDFLLTTPDVVAYDYIVGNPPYVRQESIPEVLLTEYRRRFATLYDRADLYVLFYERALSLLANKGQLGFICSDRWVKNRYGGPLRKLIASNYHLKIFVDMVDTAAFSSDVIAYPAITVIEKAAPGLTRVAIKPTATRAVLEPLVAALRDGVPSADVTETGPLPADQPWVMESNPELQLVRRLEAQFPLIEEAGCKIGIGVATGADKAFIAPYDDLDVEPERKLPLVKTRDIVSGDIVWRGDAVLNPFEENGSLADLTQYPRFAAYIESHRDLIAARHVAKKAPDSWYRTIDRITPSLMYREKLLIPDIKGEANIVLDQGKYYPHHNLYFMVSDEWDIRALQTVLRSGIASLFVAAYSTRMRGGYLRFQAQYLRRIRLPHWSDVPSSLRTALIDARRQDDVTALISELYGLSGGEVELLKNNNKEAMRVA
ncbi:MAG: Eco57I restriction-modification methylase domain-containing protein [Alcanivoracaceae bacterium]